MSRLIRPILLLLLTFAQPSLAGSLRYGADGRQAVTLWPVAGRPRAAMLLYVHGGGWSRGSARDVGVKPRHFNALGHGFGSVGYRLLPQVKVEDQAGDIARAIAALRRRGVERFVLIGHSSGAHLAALVGTDPRYLRAAGVPFRALRGVILLDAAAIDVPAAMASNAGSSPYYLGAFGLDRARQAALSPLNFAGRPDAPNWLIMHDAARADAAQDGLALATKLRLGGARADIVAIPETTHMRLTDDLGKPGDRATAVVDRFLAERVAR